MLTVSHAQSSPLNVYTSPSSGPAGTTFQIIVAGGGFEGQPFECSIMGIGVIGFSDYYAPIYYTVPTSISPGTVLSIYCYQPTVPDSGPWANYTSFFVSEIDSDGDGITDNQDSCPNTFALTQNGCPADSDGDGIPDDSDACPNTFAQTFNGCPADSDGDGIPDDSDACPNTFAQTFNGCPADSDGDGIPDNSDACPNTFAQTFNGCPADSDGDGIPDNSDACPNTFAQTFNGCLPPTATATRIPATRVPPTATPTATPDMRLALPTTIDLNRLANCSNLLPQTASLSRVQLIRVLSTSNPCGALTEALRRARFGGPTLPNPFPAPLNNALRCSTDPRPVPSADFMRLAGIYHDLYGSDRANRMITWVGVSDGELCAAQIGDPFRLAFEKRIVDPLVLVDYYMGACYGTVSTSQMSRALRHIKERRDDERLIRILTSVNPVFTLQRNTQVWCSYVQTLNRELPPTSEEENALLRRLQECRVFGVGFNPETLRTRINTGAAGYSWRDLNAFLSYYGRRCPSRADYERFVANGGVFLEAVTIARAEVATYPPVMTRTFRFTGGPACPTDSRDLPTPESSVLMKRMEIITGGLPGTFGSALVGVGASETDRARAFAATLSEDAVCAFMSGDPFGTHAGIPGGSSDRDLISRWYTSACLGGGLTDTDYWLAAEAATMHPDFDRVVASVMASSDKRTTWCDFIHGIHTGEIPFPLGTMTDTPDPTSTPVPSLGDPDLDYLLDCGFASADYLELIRTRGHVVVVIGTERVKVPYEDFIGLVREWRALRPNDCFDPDFLTYYARTLLTGEPFDPATAAAKPDPDLSKRTGDPDWDFLIECVQIDVETINSFTAVTRADGRIYLFGDTPLPFTLEQMRAWAADFRARGVCPTSDDVAEFQRRASEGVTLEIVPVETFFEIEPTPAPRRSFGDEDWDFLAECGTIPADYLADILSGIETAGGISVRGVMLPFTRAQLRAWAQNWRTVYPDTCPTPDDHADFVMSMAGVERTSLGLNAVCPTDSRPIPTPEMIQLLERLNLISGVAYGTIEEQIASLLEVLSTDGLCAFMQGDPFSTSEAILSGDSMFSSLYWTTECFGGDVENEAYSVFFTDIVHNTNTPSVMRRVRAASSRAERARLWCEHANAIVRDRGIPVEARNAAQFLIECGVMNEQTAEDLLRMLATQGASNPLLAFFPPIGLEGFIRVIEDWQRNQNTCMTLEDFLREISRYANTRVVTTISAELTVRFNGGFAGNVYTVECNQAAAGFSSAGYVPMGCRRINRYYVEPNDRRDPFEAGIAGLLIEVNRGRCSSFGPVVASTVTDGFGNFSFSGLTNEPHCLKLSRNSGANALLLNERGMWWTEHGRTESDFIYEFTPYNSAPGYAVPVLGFGWWPRETGTTTRTGMGDENLAEVFNNVSIIDINLEDYNDLTNINPLDFLPPPTPTPSDPSAPEIEYVPVNILVEVYRANCDPTLWSGDLRDVPEGCMIGRDGRIYPDTIFDPARGDVAVEGFTVEFRVGGCDAPTSATYFLTTAPSGRISTPLPVHPLGDVLCVIADATRPDNAARLGSGRWGFTDSAPRVVSMAFVDVATLAPGEVLRFSYPWWDPGISSAAPMPGATVTPVPPEGRPFGPGPSGAGLAGSVPIRPVRDVAACPPGGACPSAVTLGRPAVPNAPVAPAVAPPRGVVRFPLPAAPRVDPPLNTAQLDADLGPSWREVQLDTTARGVFIGRDPQTNAANLYMIEGGQIYEIGEAASSEAAPSFGPLGTEVAFIGRDDEGRATLFIMNVVSGAYRSVFSDSFGLQLLDEAPAWSSDGRTLFFSAQDERGPAIFRLNLDTPDLAPTLVVDNARQPALTSDGLLMAFVRDGSVVVRFLDTGDEYPVSTAAEGSACEQPFFDANGLDLFFICRSSERAALYWQGTGDLREVPTGTETLVYAGAGPTSGTLIWDDGETITLASSDGTNAAPFIRLPDLRVTQLRWAQ
ncbi:MAG: thrombospondin type 3 repeat-containing protein [Anaerolinea sp.]